MSFNDLLAIELFVKNAQLFELYSIGIANEARKMSATITSDPEFQVKLATVIRYFLSLELQFNSNNRAQLTALAMQEAVTGESPRITLNLASEQLTPVTESEIKDAIVGQFTDTGPLNQLLQRNVVKFTFNLQ